MHRRAFGITGGWIIASLAPGAWYDRVSEGGYGYVTAWVGEKEERGGQGCGCTRGDLRKLEIFQSRVDWTEPKTPKAATAAPTLKTKDTHTNIHPRARSIIDPPSGGQKMRVA